MNLQYRTAAELKRQARGQLLGRYGTAISASLLIDVIMIILTMVTSNVVDTRTMVGLVLYSAILFILGILNTILIVGELTIYFDFHAGLPTKATKIFRGFFEGSDRIVLTAIALFAICYAWFAPGIAVVIMYLKTQDGLYLALSIALMLIATIISLYISIITSQSYYILLDFPELSVPDIIRTSSRMMLGHKWTLVRIYLSFIPMCILGVLSAGIGFLYIEPYIKGTMTAFYMDIAAEGSESDKGTNFDIIVED